MPDFDEFERTVRTAFIGKGTAKLSAVALELSRIPDENRIKMAKNKSSSELLAFLKRADVALRLNFKNPEVAEFTTSDDNRVGKDLVEINSGRDVELKSGDAMTDGNCGVKLIAWAIGCSENSLVDVMNRRAEQRRNGILFDSWTPQVVQKHKNETMNLLAYLFSESISVGQKALGKLDHFCRSVAIGRTKETEIKTTFGQVKGKEKPLMLKFDWDLGVTVYDKAFTENDVITCVESGRTSDRAQIKLVGSVSSRSMRIYPNFKNSYTDPKTGRKIAAENWVQTPCFQIWVK